MKTRASAASAPLDPERERSLTTLLILAVVFVGATMTANVMSLRMVSPLGIVFDAGTILYPVTFLVRDQIHRRAGKGLSDTVVLVSALANLAMFACFFIVAWLPADPATGPQEEFGRVLLPGILIVLGSVVGQYVAERIDGVIYHRIYREGEGSATRAAILSNLVSIPVDSALMSTIAFAATVPFVSYASAMAVNVVLKYAITMGALTASIGITNVVDAVRTKGEGAAMLPDE